MVFGKIVEIEAIDTDRYGRTVGIVTADGLNVNQEIVRNGYAWVYTRYCKKPVCGEWKGLETAARANKAGLWAHPDPVPPWDFRRRKSLTATEKAQSLDSAQIQTQGIAYTGNTKSRKFHKASCRYANCKNCTEVFRNRAEAIDQGYVPCKNCNP